MTMAGSPAIVVSAERHLARRFLRDDRPPRSDAGWIAELNTKPPRWSTGYPKPKRPRTEMDNSWVEKPAA